MTSYVVIIVRLLSSIRVMQRKVFKMSNWTIRSFLVNPPPDSCALCLNKKVTLSEKCQKFKKIINCRQKNVPFDGSYSTEFKTGREISSPKSKTSKNDDFLRKKVSKAQITLKKLLTRFFTKITIMK